MRTAKVWMVMAMALLAACKHKEPPPTALAYTAPAFFTVGTAITPLTPTVTGTVTGYAVSPTLPTGLALDTTTGRISGTPTATSATAAYTVTASNARGSTNATLNFAVYSLPAISTQPANQSVQAPATATFTAAATGTPTPTLKWQQSTDNGTTWSDIAGATAASYTTPATVIGDSGKRLRAVATNAAGSTNSAAATLTVTAPPVGKAWTPAALIGQVTTGNNSLDATLVMSASGRGILAWMQSDGAVRSIYYSDFTQAGGWTPPAPLESGSGPAQNVRIVMDDSGNAFAIWQQQVDGTGTWHVMTSRRLVGAGFWETAVRIDSQPFTTTAPDIGMDAQGNALAVWTQSVVVGGFPRLYTNRYTAGSGWESAGPIDTADLYNGSEARIAVNAAGSAVAVLTARQFPADEYIQRGVAYTPATGWGVGAKLTTVSYAGSPQVAIDAAGNAIMAISSRATSGGPKTVIANLYRNGAWSGPTNIGADAEGDYVNVAMDRTGHAFVLWGEYGGGAAGGGGSGLNVYSRRATVAANTWDATELVDQSDEGTISNPRLAIDGDGVAFAVWREPNLNVSAIHIWANRRNPVSGWGTAEKIGVGGFLFGPLVGADANGDALAVWHSDVSSTERAQYFSAYR